MTEQIEQIDTLDTLELIIQPTITTKKDLLKQIRELKEQFKEHQANQIVEPPNTDEQPILKRSIKGRPKLPDDQKKHLSADYFNEYYRTHLKVEVKCEHCGCKVVMKKRKPTQYIAN